MFSRSAPLHRSVFALIPTIVSSLISCFFYKLYLKTPNLPQVALYYPNSLLEVRQLDLDLDVEPTRTQQRRVQHLDPVGGPDHHDLVVHAEPVHLCQQLVQRADPLRLALPVILPLVSYAVNLVQKDYRRRVIPSLLEECSDSLGSHTDVLLHELSGTAIEKLNSALVGGGLGEEGFTGAWRAIEEDASPEPCADGLELFGIVHVVDNLGELLLSEIKAVNILEVDISFGHLEGVALGAEDEAGSIAEAPGDEHEVEELVERDLCVFEALHLRLLSEKFVQSILTEERHVGAEPTVLVSKENLQPVHDHLLNHVTRQSCQEVTQLYFRHLIHRLVLHCIRRSEPQRHRRKHPILVHQLLATAIHTINPFHRDVLISFYMSEDQEFVSPQQIILLQSRMQMAAFLTKYCAKTCGIWKADHSKPTLTNQEVDCMKICGANISTTFQDFEIAVRDSLESD